MGQRFRFLITKSHLSGISCSKNSIEKQDGRFVAMVTKDLQTLNLKLTKSCLIASFSREKKFRSDV